MQRKQLLAQIAKLSIFVVAILTFTLAGCGGGGDVGNTQQATSRQMGGAVQGIALNLIPTVSILAGAMPGADGTGATARFERPTGIASDGTNLYVADNNSNKIRKIVIATGVVTTLAGTGMEGATDGAGALATFFNPSGITTDGAYLYVTDSRNRKIRKIEIATGTVSSLTGSTASFNYPAGITTDGTNLYVVDAGAGQIRKVVIATGAVSTLAGVSTSGVMLLSVGGGGSPPVAADGPGLFATFSSPSDIATDGVNLYVTDYGNNKIRKIVIATGVVSSFTGVPNTASVQGAADGVATSATFCLPQGITTDGVNLYVTDAGNNKVRKIVIATGVVSSLTGMANTAGEQGAMNGAGAAATFAWPAGITIGGNNLYLSEISNKTIRSVALADAAVSTLAGNVSGSDGVGATASFSHPSDVVSDGINLYVADSSDNKIRKIMIASGEVTTLAGTGESGAADGAGSVATFNWPTCITTDGINLYVGDYGNYKIRKIVIATGVVSSMTGVANTAGVRGAVDGASAMATFSSPLGITTDGNSLYVADTFNDKIRKIVITTGMVSSLTGIANTAGIQGATDGAGATATFIAPQGITTDGSNIYVADRYNNKIRKIVIATGVVSSFTGATNTAGAAGAADGDKLSATFNSPTGITTDGSSLYVSDLSNHKIRKIVIGTGVVSSLTGIANTVGANSAIDGAGTTATFASPFGITTDGSSLYVTDTNNTIRKIR
jgi:sugar lactone lactonase YvrE